jgi:hypothetical protein
MRSLAWEVQAGGRSLQATGVCDSGGKFLGSHHASSPAGDFYTFLPVLEAGNPRSQYWHGQFLLRPLFLAGRWLCFTVLTWSFFCVHALLESLCSQSSSYRIVLQLEST